jgi:hypothetical protein
MDNASLISAGFAFLSALIYSFLGWRLSRRSVSVPSRLPAAQFAAFWLGLAALTAVVGLESLAAAFVLPSLAVAVTILYLEILVLCVVLWGLLGYLLYLFTGRSFLGPLSVAYGAVYVVLLYLVTTSDPTGVFVRLGTVMIEFGGSVGSDFGILLLVALILPEFVGALLYFSLVFRTPDRTVRYRVSLVSGSLIIWFGLAPLNISSLLGGGLLADLLSRSVGTFAGLVTLLAYYPPRAVQVRFGVATIDQPSQADV